MALPQGATATLTANKTVTWSVSGGGSVTPQGPSTVAVYTAPAFGFIGTGQQATVTATDSLNPLNVGRATIWLAQQEVTASPTTGGALAGVSTTFTFTVSDSWGLWGNWTVLLLGNLGTWPNGCGISLLTLPTLTLAALADDSGSWSTSGQIGTTASGGGDLILSNSQCSVDLTTATASTGGTVSTVKLPIRFTGNFIGTWQWYQEVTDAQTGGPTIGLIPTGASWSVNDPPVYVSPPSATMFQGQSQTFALAGGGIAHANWTLSGTATNNGTLSTTTNVPAASTIYTAPATGITVGQRAIVTATDPASSANNGTATVTLYGASSSMSSTSQSSTAGQSTTFTLTATDTAGINGNVYGFLWFGPASSFNSPPVGGSSCLVWVILGTGYLSLARDDGSYMPLVPIGPAAASGSLSNSQCTVDATNTTLSVNSSTGTATVNLPITFQPAWSGTSQNVWTDVDDIGNGFDLYWAVGTSWTIH